MSGFARSSGPAIAALTAPVILVALFNGFYLPALERMGAPLFWCVDVLSWVALPAVLLLLLFRHFRVRSVDYGFGLPQEGLLRFVFFTLLATLILGTVFFGVRNHALPFFGYPAAVFQFEDMEKAGLSGYVIWIYSALSAGFIESIFYIGLPWLACQRWRSVSPWLFSLVSAFVFACVHWEQGPHVLMAAFAFGLAACAWFFWRRNLWHVAIAHTLIDLYSFY